MGKEGQGLIVWEIFVPNSFALTKHKAWDKKVREISNGLTIYKPVRGHWLGDDGIVEETMIPVRIACSTEQIDKIAAIMLEHYEQQAVMYYLITDKVFIKTK